MKTTSLVDEVEETIEMERALGEAHRKAKEIVEREAEEEQSLLVEKSMKKIVRQLLVLVKKDKGVRKMLCNPDFHHPIRRSPTQESVAGMPTDDPAFRKMIVSHLTPAQRKRRKAEIKEIKKRVRKYEQAHRPLLEIFTTLAVSDVMSRLKGNPSGGWGIKLVTLSEQELRAGQYSRKISNVDVYYHIMLVLGQGKLRVAVHKPYFDAGEWWGDPISPERLPDGVIKKIHTLAEGGRTMVETIMRSRVKCT